MPGEVIKLPSDSGSKGPVVQTQADFGKSASVPVIAPDGTYGTVPAENLTYYLNANKGATIAPDDVVARKDAEAAEAAKELADPFKYRDEQYAKREAEIDAADAELGLAGQIAGGLFAASPLGQVAAVSQLGRQAGTPGADFRNPLPALARTQYGILDPAGLTSAGIAGMFGDEGKAFLDRQRKAPGYAEGRGIGLVAGGEAAQALAEGAQVLGWGIEGATSEATDAYLGNRETSAQKLAMAGLIGAAGAAIPYAAAGALEGTAQGARKLGSWNEALTGESATSSALNRAIKAAGQDPQVYRQANNVTSALHTAEDITHSVRNMENVVSQETNNLTQLYRNAEVAKAAAKVETRALQEEVAGVLQEMRADATPVVESPAWAREAEKIQDPRVRKIYEDRKAVKQAAADATAEKSIAGDVAGANRFLTEVAKIAPESVTPDMLPGLKSLLTKKGLFPTGAERRGASAVYKRLEGRMSNALSEADPARFGDFASLQKQLDTHNVVLGILKDGQPTKLPGLGQGMKETIANASSFSTALGLSAIFNGHLGIGTLAMLSKGAAKEAYNFARRAVPNAVAGEKLATAIRSVDHEVKTTARAIAASIVTANDTKSDKPSLPTRAEFDKAVSQLETMSEKLPDIEALREVDEGLYASAIQHHTQVAQNSLAQVKNKGLGVTGNSQHVSSGTLGDLFQDKTHKPKDLQPSELAAWDYIRTVLDPMGAIKGMRSHRISNQSLLALQENFPDVIAQLQDELIQSITETTKQAHISLDSRAYMARVLGKPVDVTTDPKFAAALRPTVTGPQPPVSSPNVVSSRSAEMNTATESERIEQ